MTPGGVRLIPDCVEPTFGDVWVTEMNVPRAPWLLYRQVQGSLVYFFVSRKAISNTWAHTLRNNKKA